MIYHTSNWDATDQPCPCGKSSDAYAVDVKGNGYCFSCGESFFKKKKEEPLNLDEIAPEDKEIGHFPHRGLNQNTVEFFDISTLKIKGEPYETSFPFPDDGWKIRKHHVEGKKNRFITKGKMAGQSLWGKQFFDPGSRDSITITVGMYDGPSIWQVTNGNTAAVTCQSDQSAKKECAENFEYINSFNKIILCFDNDESGREARAAVASLFDFNKVYKVELTKYKDPNDYLLNDDAPDLYKVWSNARKLTPDNVINTFDDIEKALAESKDNLIVDYPFEKLNEALWGLSAGEVIVIKGDEGIGKTEFFRAMEYHILNSTKKKGKKGRIPIGIIHLEEDNATTIKAVATYELGEDAITPDSTLTNEDVLAAYKAALDNDEEKAYIHTAFDVHNEDELLNNIRFLVSASGCKVVFFDHITWLATGQDDGDDERKKLDRISQRLKLLAKELKFAMVEISHVNDDGKTRGSRNITKVANTVIHLHRDITHADPVQRNRTYIVVEKARLGGRTGPAGYVEFDPSTGMLADPRKPELELTRKENVGENE